MLRWIAASLVAAFLYCNVSTPVSTPVHAMAPDDSVVLKNTIGCPGTQRICVMSSNDGGQFQDWLKAFPITFLQGIYLVINSECNSACELFAEWMSANVCVTSQATFGFHQAYNAETKTFKPIRHTYLIQQLIDKHGGAPASRSHEDLLVIGADEVLATHFWRHCEIQGDTLVFQE